MSHLEELTSLFYSSCHDLGEFTPVEAEDLPQAYISLLAHHDHMTVTVEAWHNSLVDVHVLQEHRDQTHYARQVLLVRQRDNEVVQFGIMRIRLEGLPEIVRMEIQSKALPLGRILIRHHVLREVELLQLWRVKPGPQLRLKLRLKDQRQVYGRTARIVVEGQPTVELLEIVKA